MTRSRIHWQLISQPIQERIMRRFHTALIAVAAGFGPGRLAHRAQSSPSCRGAGSQNALVQVVNEPSNPVPIYDVHNPACSPFQIELVIAVPNGQTHVRESFTVPRDRRLVIEHVSASGFGQGFILTHVYNDGKRRGGRTLPRECSTGHEPGRHASIPSVTAHAMGRGPGDRGPRNQLHHSGERRGHPRHPLGLLGGVSIVLQVTTLNSQWGAALDGARPREGRQWSANQQ